MLRVNSIPWSIVYVDGHAIGNTPQMSVPLASGPHRVDFVNTQFGLRKTLKVAIQNGKTATHIVKLAP